MLPTQVTDAINFLPLCWEQRLYYGLLGHFFPKSSISGHVSCLLFFVFHVVKEGRDLCPIETVFALCSGIKKKKKIKVLDTSFMDCSHLLRGKLIPPRAHCGSKVQGSEEPGVIS